jgi:Zonular occludens toxin (Zot)
MLYSLIGDVGSGKTLKVSPWMEQAVASGRPVFSSIELTEQCPFREKVALIGTDAWPIARTPARHERVCKERQWVPSRRPMFFWEYVPDGALVIVDEAQLYFNSNDWKRIGEECEWYHTQHRKFGHDVIYITQRIGNLYNRIRDLCGRYILAEHNYRTARVFGYVEALLGRQAALNMSRFFYYEYIDPALSPKALKGEGHFTYAEAKRFFGWYNTKQVLGDVTRAVRKFLITDEVVSRVSAFSGDSDEAAFDGSDVDGSRGVGAAAVAATIQEVGADSGGDRVGLCGVPVDGAAEH